MYKFAHTSKGYLLTSIGNISGHVLPIKKKDIKLPTCMTRFVLIDNLIMGPVHKAQFMEQGEAM